MSSNPKFYVTTAIPYVNGKPHIGHALEFVQTDVVARFHRQLGEDVFFLTGTDDNSLKNVRAAEVEGIPTRELVERNSNRFVELTRLLEISNNDFIRTMEEKHFKGAQKLWAAGRPEDIYKKKYEGLYCVGCETFYSPSELEDGKCPEHQVEPEHVQEENYFFKLTNYQEKLEALIESDTYQVVPEMRKNEVLSFIRSGLQDFSISRSRERAKEWGVPVPDDPSQVMYVWYDALSNYITGLDYAEDDAGENPDNRFTHYWPCDVHVIGKGIIRFHAVYWPAMLLSAGLPLPRKLFVHGYVNLGGAKMSKSLGTVVDPVELVSKYGAETVRYYLIRHIHPVQDSDFSLESLEEAYTAGLANGIGNLLHRSLTMIQKNGGGTIQPMPLERDAEREIARTFEAICADYERLMQGFEFSQALNRVWEGVAALDGYINTQAPWAMAKDPEKAKDLPHVLYTLAEGLRLLGSLIYATMPASAAEIWRRLGLSLTPLEVDWPTQKQWGYLPAGLKIDKSQPLFPRLESDERAKA